MGCWGATKEFFSNCCGGPHSEHYDAWLARERLRQLNAQTQRVDQLTRENTILGTALAQSQDILSSYNNIEAYDSPEPTPYPSTAPVPLANIRNSSRQPSQGMNRGTSGAMSRHSSVSSQLPESPAGLSRSDISNQPSRTSGAATRRTPSPLTLRPSPVARNPSSGPPTPTMQPTQRALLTSRMATIGTTPPSQDGQAPKLESPFGAQQLAAQAAAERQAVMNNLMRPLPAMPVMPALSPRNLASVAEHQTASTGKYPRTHGYAPGVTPAPGPAQASE